MLSYENKNKKITLAVFIMLVKHTCILMCPLKYKHLCSSLFSANKQHNKCNSIVKITFKGESLNKNDKSLGLTNIPFLCV